METFGTRILDGRKPLSFRRGLCKDFWTFILNFCSGVEVQRTISSAKHTSISIETAECK